MEEEERGTPAAPDAIDGQSLKPILVLGADDLVPSLKDELAEVARIFVADELSSATEAFKTHRPELVVWGLDQDGWKLIPVIRMARHQGVPVLPVASTREVQASIKSGKWALDRRKEDAVVSAAKRLLNDPSFVPRDVETYPPPPPSMAGLPMSAGPDAPGAERGDGEGAFKRDGDIGEENDEGGRKAEVLAVSAPRSSPHGESARPSELVEVERRFEALESRLQISVMRAWDESSEHFVRQANALSTLGERLDGAIEIDARARASLEDRLGALSSEMASMKSVFEQVADAVTADGNALREALEARMGAAAKDLQAVRADLSSQVDALAERLDAAPTSEDIAALDFREHLGDLAAIIDGLAVDFEALRGHLAGRITDQAASCQRLQEKLDALASAVADGDRALSALDRGVTGRLEAVERRLVALDASLENGTGRVRDWEPAVEGRIKQLERLTAQLERLVSVREAPGPAASGEREGASPSTAPEMEVMSQAIVHISTNLDLLDDSFTEAERSRNKEQASIARTLETVGERFIALESAQETLFKRLEDFDARRSAAPVSVPPVSVPPVSPSAGTTSSEVEGATPPLTAVPPPQPDDGEDTLLRVRASLAKFQKDWVNRAKS